jgi:hypothetical protein
MMKKILLAAAVSAFCFVGQGFCERVLIEENLSVIDQYKHTPEQFLSVLDEINTNQPKYSIEKVGDMVVRSYYEVIKSNNQLTIYDVALGIKRFSQDKLGIDLKDLIVTYIESQT